MDSGLVVQTTPSLTAVLGYPRDMWTGRSITDFVHPEDRDHLIRQITLNIHQPIDAITETSTITHKSGNFFCRMRQYSGLKLGFSVKDRKKNFRFLKICVCFSEVEISSATAGRQPDSDGLGIYLFLTAIPLNLPYKIAHEEGPITVSPSNPRGRFTTKHNADCVWTFVDEDTVPLLGHFPHELEGSNIFEIIHPQDLSILKDSFECLVLGREHVSKPYRMKTRNSDYAIVLTSWSCFVNPWTNNLEFINGKHTIVKGPRNPNIFTEHSTFEGSQEKASNETIKMLSFLQDDIKLILQRYVRKKHIYDRTRLSSPKSKSRLSSYLDTLRQKVANAESCTGSRSSVNEEKANTSLHLSNSSDSLPSHNQLRYKENMSRFFNSNPRTLLIKEIVSDILHSTTSGYTDDHRVRTKDDVLTSSSREVVDTNYKPPILTESLLLVHNQKMEVQMVEQYKEARAKNRKITSQSYKTYLNKERTVPCRQAKDEQKLMMPSFQMGNIQNIIQVEHFLVTLSVYHFWNLALGNTATDL